MRENDRLPSGRAVLYGELLCLAKQQTSALHADDLPSFITLMNEREALMQRLAGRPGLEPRGPGGLGTVILAAQIGEILTVDRENQRLLAEALKETKAELQRLYDGRAVLSRYGHICLPKEARFCDRIL